MRFGGRITSVAILATVLLLLYYAVLTSPTSIFWKFHNSVRGVAEPILNKQFNHGVGIGQYYGDASPVRQASAPYNHSDHRPFTVNSTGTGGFSGNKQVMSSVPVTPQGKSSPALPGGGALSSVAAIQTHLMVLSNDSSHNGSTAAIDSKPTDGTLSESQASLFANFENDTHMCYTDLSSEEERCRLKCPAGQFALAGMVRCVAWLRCENFGEIKREEEFCKTSSTLKCRNHAVKRLYMATWEGFRIVLALVAHEQLFQHGLDNIVPLQGNDSFVIRYLGGCKGKWLATEYYPNGGLGDFEKLLTGRLARFDNPFTRFHLCLSYARQLQFLNHLPSGPRVLTDSDILSKTMTQYVLSDNLNIVISDVDILPRAVNGTVCAEPKHRPFIAPEQVCQNGTGPPSDTAKTIIWKFPFICKTILGEPSRTSSTLRIALSDVFRSCHRLDPELRPDADGLVRELEEIGSRVFGNVTI